MNNRPPRVLLWVQHLLGTGHVVRAAALARALQAKGAAVRILSGNTWPKSAPAAGLDIEELPPARTKDATFTQLVHPDGTPVDEAWRTARKEAVGVAFETYRPDILLTETFPMGRRALRHELIPLLLNAKGKTIRPLIAASVRDILVVKNDAEKDRFMADTANRFYDVLLVHSDPDVITLDRTFPLTGEIENKLAYTGFVRPHGLQHPASGSDGTNEVIVSCGGGAVGLSLLRAALHAKPLSSASTNTWRFLVGHDVAEGDHEALYDHDDRSIIIERARPDFPELLKRARLSVSQAGYNTVLDILAAKVPAVFVPFAQEEENEQGVRALLMKERGLAAIADEKTLTPQSLADAVDEALLLSPSRHDFQTDGAKRSAEILLERLERHRSNRT